MKMMGQMLFIRNPDFLFWHSVSGQIQRRAETDIAQEKFHHILQKQDIQKSGWQNAEFQVPGYLLNISQHCGTFILIIIFGLLWMKICFIIFLPQKNYLKSISRSMMNTRNSMMTVKYLYSLVFSFILHKSKEL